MQDLKRLEPLGQFRIRNLLVLMAGAGVLFAVLATLVKDLSGTAQISALVQAVVLVVVVVCSSGYILFARQKVERRAGRRIERFGRFSGKLLHWALLVLFLGGYLFEVGFKLRTARPGAFVLMPPSPFLLFFAVNYLVVRVWWKVDPMGLEACEHGLIQGAWHFIAWDDISRFSWSGKSGLQLNLFLKQRMVMHVRTDASFAGRLDQILAEHLGKPAAAAAPTE